MRTVPTYSVDDLIGVKKTDRVRLALTHLSHTGKLQQLRTSPLIEIDYSGENPLLITKNTTYEVLPSPAWLRIALTIGIPLLSPTSIVPPQ